MKPCPLARLDRPMDALGRFAVAADHSGSAVIPRVHCNLGRDFSLGKCYRRESPQVATTYGPEMIKPGLVTKPFAFVPRIFVFTSFDFSCRILCL